MSEQEENTGGALRTQLEEALKANKELKSQVHNLTVSQLVSDKGLDKRIANLVPAGTEDIGSWLDENADLFASSQAKSEPEEALAPPPVEAPESAVKAATIEAGGASPESALEFQQRMDSAKTPEELKAIMSDANRFFNPQQ